MEGTMPRLRCRTDPNYNFNASSQQKQNAITGSEIDELLQHPRIKESFAIDAFNRERFGLKYLDPSFAVTPSISSHPSYLSILAAIRQYNDQTSDLLGDQRRSMHAKKEIMDVTLNMLRIMMLSSSSETKMNVLDLTWEWLRKQLKLKSEGNIGEHREESERESARGTELPSEWVKSEREDFKALKRTEYKDRDAARFQLENYRTRRINLFERNPQTETEQENDKLKRVTFKRRNFSHFQLGKDQSQRDSIVGAEKEEMKERFNTIETMPHTDAISPPPQLPTQLSPLAELAQEQTQFLNEKETVLPSGGLTAFLQSEEQMPDQSNPANQSLESEPGLDPKIKAYASSILPPSATPHQNTETALLSMTYLQRQSKSLKQTITREDYDIVKRMQAWAGTRSKFKSELNRKIESSRLFFKENQGERKNRFKEGKINEAIKEGKEYLRGYLQRNSSGDKEPGLSVYCQGRTKIGSTRSAKTLEVILRENSREKVSERGLQEVEELKEKLSKKKVYASLAMLKNSMLVPQDEELPVLTSRLQRPLSLLANPLIKKKRKKLRI